MVASWTLKASGSPGGMVADATEAARAFALFADPDAGCEVMALRSGVRRTLPGADVAGLVKAAEEMPAGAGVYFRINSVSADLTRPAKNGDVLRRRWLYIDVDPVKPEAFKDDPSTDAEKDATRQVCERVHDHLAAAGWPPPVIVDSGNGFGLFFRCDLPNDKRTQAAFRKLLADLAAKFGGPDGIIDKSVHNANRLAKVPGTWARKGACTDDRPHRPCRIVYSPEVAGVVTAEALESAAGVSGDAAGPTPGPTPGSAPSANGFTLRATAGDKTAYGRAALDAECARVVLAVPGAAGGRNNALNRAAFSLGQLVAAGVLSESEVDSRLYDAACRAGLDSDPGCGPSGIRATIRSGLEAGLKEPRAVPDRAKAATAPQPKPAPTGPVIYWASEVTPRAVEWLWRGRIPLGKLTTFAGNGGLGKTFVLCDIVARVTRGMDWPDSKGEAQPEGKCLFISGEDDPDDTLVPRMIELGADLSRVAFLRTDVLDKFTLADLPTLDKALDQMGDEVRFVAIDPPTAYLGGVNDHKNAELRGLLTPLMLWAKRRRIAVVFNTHVNKPQGAKVEAMMRVMGSVAWVNAMRSAYMFARDPHDPERRLFVGMKNNLGGEVKGLAYRIVASNQLARVEWLGEVDTTADEAVNREGSKRKRSVVAAEWLAELFKDANKLPSDAIWKAKDETTLSKDALKAAKEDMGIRAKQETDGDGNRAWYWYWPAEARLAWQQPKVTAAESDRPDDYFPTL